MHGKLDLKQGCQWCVYKCEALVWACMCHLRMCVLKWSTAKMHWLMWPNAVLLLFPLCLNVFACICVSYQLPLWSVVCLFLCMCVFIEPLTAVCEVLLLDVALQWKCNYCVSCGPLFRVLSLIQQFMLPFHVFENCHKNDCFCQCFCFYLSSVCLSSVCLSSVCLFIT